jgi:hypothetical protein
MEGIITSPIPAKKVLMKEIRLILISTHNVDRK